MKLEDLIKMIDPEERGIMLYLNGEILGAFPAKYSPKEYDNYIIDCIAPDRYDGESPLDGIVLRVWLE